MKKSNFSRYIENFADFKNAISQGFLSDIKHTLLEKGKAFLAFRNEEATIYYHGNQLCNLPAKKPFTPTVNNLYLPLCRSTVLKAREEKKTREEKYLNEREWLDEAGIDGKTFAKVLPEIRANIEKESSKESTQASKFYRFSPLNLEEDHEIVLLDFEAAFERTERIYLVFYNTAERRLMFVEVKRLEDSRLYGKDNQQAEVIDQLNRYRDRLKDEDEKANINTQYNRVITYYNALSGKNLPLIQDAEPILGLLLVDFTSCEKDQKKKRIVQDAMKLNGYKMYAIGDTSNVTKYSIVQANSTIHEIYKTLK